MKTISKFAIAASLALATLPSFSCEEEDKVDLNTANVPELKTLQGVGKKKAEAIAQYRNTAGLFQSTYETTLVYGIGDKLFESNEPCLKVTFPEASEVANEEKEQTNQ